ncbi:hypothetical protein BGZ99_008490 [Dissophora globulifera]|uniref:Transmembrane protein n=1 Tax=Dissophora globulifera TaxID=979702 RepID=A0A9P6UZ02_9FUNG|nr:hypothetical protein BGZ99_008490 [Dissophora globulifera]
MNANDISLSRPRGYQYNPAATGDIKWSNVDVTDGYGWNSLSLSAMFTLSSTTGDTLLHVFSGIVSNAISVALYDKDKKTFELQNASWPMPTSSGTPYGYAASNNNLYVLSKDFLTSTTHLNIMPVSPLGTPPASDSIKVINASATLSSSCYLIGGAVQTVAYGNNYYVFCSDAGNDINYLVSYNGSVLSEPVKTNASINLPQSFYPITGAGGSAPTWAFMNNSTNVFGLSVAGANIGAWQVAPYVWNATGIPSTGSGPGSGGGDGSSNRSSSNGSSHTVVIAVSVSAVIFLIGVTSFFFRWRNRAQRKQPVEMVQTYQVHSHPVMASALGHQQFPIQQQQPYPPLQQQQQQQQLPPWQPLLYNQTPPQPIVPSYAPEQVPSNLGATSGYALPPTSRPHFGFSQSEESQAQYQQDNGQLDIWTPTISAGTTTASDTPMLSSNSPEYSNGSLSSPHHYSGGSSQNSPQFTGTGTGTGSPQRTQQDPRNPQLYRPVAAPQDFGEDGVLAAAGRAANYRPGPEER